jgi:urea transport system ATP-binding protein
VSASVVHEDAHDYEDVDEYVDVDVDGSWWDMTLAVQNINQFYGQSHTLWGVNLSLREGKCTCLMGRNGVGKTTLLKTIMGLVQATGSVQFAGGELLGKRPEVRARVGIGYVPQGREIFPQLTVEENLRLGLSARKDKARDIPEKIFSWFPVLRSMSRRRGGDLSGGQQQQLAIGRAMILEPKVLILDEPTEGIQPNIVEGAGDDGAAGRAEAAVRAQGGRRLRHPGQGAAGGLGRAPRADRGACGASPGGVTRAHGSFLLARGTAHGAHASGAGGRGDRIVHVHVGTRAEWLAGRAVAGLRRPAGAQRAGARAAPRPAARAATVLSRA